MATNRLFIYDPQNKTAVCIAKGYSNGWMKGEEYIDNWFDDNAEFTGDIEETRFILKTENTLPIDTKVKYGSENSYKFIKRLKFLFTGNLE